MLLFAHKCLSGWLPVQTLCSWRDIIQSSRLSMAFPSYLLLIALIISCFNFIEVNSTTHAFQTCYGPYSCWSFFQIQRLVIFEQLLTIPDISMNTVGRFAAPPPPFVPRCVLILWQPRLTSSPPPPALSPLITSQHCLMLKGHYGILPNSHWVICYDAGN